MLGVVGETGAASRSPRTPSCTPPTGEGPGRSIRRVEQLTLPGEAARSHRGDAISIVFQNPGTAFNPVFRLGQQMRMVLKRHRDLRGDEGAELIAAAAERRRSDRHQARGRAAYPHELSGGMLQRVMIAMALLCEPEAADPRRADDGARRHGVPADPAADPAAPADRLGFSVLLITHDLGVVKATCDRVAVLYAGRVVETGPTDTVLKNPEHPYTRGLVGALPRLSRGAARLDRGPGAGQLPGPAGMRLRRPVPGSDRHLSTRRSRAGAQLAGPRGRLPPGG